MTIEQQADEMVEAIIGEDAHVVVAGMFRRILGPVLKEAFLAGHEAGKMAEWGWRSFLVKNLAVMYRSDPVGTAALCDEKLDPTGELLGLVRDASK